MSFEDAQKAFLYPYRHLSVPREGRRARVSSPRGSPNANQGGGSGAVSSPEAQPSPSSFEA
eukprot:CAMPEP_0174749026 /NCGR_PEP_ID=MMETSP1094-20130205/94816_1 /TAXON_ID=156173 /ORGANISM="Chrysochromulina brevifilum, Strain UTEX LB 985" /LENGTH=60 /DNA_ID=CAMNT_0015954171 /DNA_START=16 /DNA_END=195 /DNA_ORIENTATION=+